MTRILHIIASPNEAQSNTLKVSNSFFEKIIELHPEIEIETLDLTKIELPPLWVKEDGLVEFLSPKSKNKKALTYWNMVLGLISQFQSAEFYVISSPMWNFSVPYHLKHYIDLIVQSNYLFKYHKDGSEEGLLKNKKMLVITSRGGEYLGALKSLDTETPFFKSIFNFVGIEDITFLNVEGLDISREKKQEKILHGQIEAQKIAKSFI